MSAAANVRHPLIPNPNSSARRPSFAAASPWPRSLARRGERGQGDAAAGEGRPLVCLLPRCRPASLHPDPDIQELVDLIGVYLVDNSLAADSGYPFEFYVLADEQTVNAFALPGGQIFVTYALLAQLETEDQLAGVIGHEIGHVVTRHGAERIAQMQLTQGLTGAVVLATYDPQDPSTQRTAQVALLIGQLVTMKWGREDELEADWLGVCILHQSGYDPAEMIGVMDVLEAAGGGQLRPPEFFSTHPNFDTRDANIQQSIDNLGSCP